MNLLAVVTPLSIYQILIDKDEKKVESNRKGYTNVTIHYITYKMHEKDNCNNIKTTKNSKNDLVLIQ